MGRPQHAASDDGRVSVYVRHAVNVDTVQDWVRTISKTISGCTLPVSIAGVDPAGSTLNIVLALDVTSALPANGDDASILGVNAMELLLDLLGAERFSPVLDHEPTPTMVAAAASLSGLTGSIATPTTAETTQMAHVGQAV